MRRGFGFTGFGLDRTGAIPAALTFATPPIGTPVAWWDFADMAMTDAVADGDPITFWRDKTSNQLVLNAAGAARPTLRISGGKPYAEFNGAQVMAVTDALLAITGDLTIIMAARKPSGSLYGSIVNCQTNLGTVNAYEHRFSNHATRAVPSLFHANGVAGEEMFANSNSDFAFATWFTAAMRRTTASAVKFYGATSDSTALAITPTADASSIFRMGNRKSNGLPLTGDIACILIYASALIDADVAAARAYAAARF